MKNGFTLAEVLVSLVVIGAIVMIALPILNMSANQDNILYKSAYRTTEKAVFSLTQDTALYPTGDLSFPAAPPNTFCQDFVTKLNPVGTVNCLTDASLASGIPSFTTTNGMRWWFSSAANPNFTVDPITIWVDINGNREPNSATATNKDILKIYVYKSGKIAALDTKEIGYLSQ